jgi:hypothetical protein
MHRNGVLDVLGYGMPARLYDELQGVDLTADTGAFTGDALIVQVAKRPTLASELEALRDRLEAGGARCRTEVLREPPGATFGSAQFVATTGNLNVRTDVMAPLSASLGRLTAGWAAS